MARRLRTAVAPPRWCCSAGAGRRRWRRAKRSSVASATSSGFPHQDLLCRWPWSGVLGVRHEPVPSPSELSAPRLVVAGPGGGLRTVLAGARRFETDLDRSGPSTPTDALLVTALLVERLRAGPPQCRRHLADPTMSPDGDPPPTAGRAEASHLARTTPRARRLSKSARPWPPSASSAHRPRVACGASAGASAPDLHERAYVHAPAYHIQLIALRFTYFDSQDGLGYLLHGAGTGAGCRSDVAEPERGGGDHRRLPDRTGGHLRRTAATAASPNHKLYGLPGRHAC